MPDERATHIDDAQLQAARRTLQLHVNRLEAFEAPLDPLDRTIASFVLIGEWFSRERCDRMLLGLADRTNTSPHEVFRRCERILDAAIRFGQEDRHA